MHENTISCVVPVYNGARYLSEALESIFQQSYAPFEVIVIDDGSTDATAEIAAAYGSQVRYLYQPNSGDSAARNAGITMAGGDFVAFLDADDLWHLEKLSKQAEILATRPEIAAGVTLIQNFLSPELCDQESRFELHRINHVAPGYVASTLMTRRTVFERVGLFNTSTSHASKTDWFLRVEEQGLRVDLLSEILVYHRIHDANMSSRDAKKSLEDHLLVLKASLDRRRSAANATNKPAA